MSLATPAEIANALERVVFGQRVAVQEMAIALSKKLAGLRSSNVLLIGSSGSGKTTLMKAVEGFLVARPELATQAAVLRLHANVLGEEAERGRPGQVILGGLLERARQLLGERAELEKIIDCARAGIVFVDEVDKIRSLVGGEAHVRGTRAQEALLTLMENESVTVELPAWAGGGHTQVDSRDLLFVAGGAFEGLYDSVFDRVTVGEDRGSLKPVTVVEDGVLREELPFRLRDWLRSEDLYRYGMSPQFLSRFASTVLLDELTEEDLVRIFLESPDSSYHAAGEFFRAYGVELALSPDAVRHIARVASKRPRIGARALREVFSTVIKAYEYDPIATASSPGVLTLDEAQVRSALNARSD